MKVFIHVRQLGKRAAKVEACPYEFATVPGTLRQMIAMLVSDEVTGYNLRLAGKEHFLPRTNAQMEDMCRAGKIGFGIPYGSNPADYSQSLETALQSFADGLYRVFIGQREVESLDAPLRLQEEDTITILRLVMLTGGYFR